MSASLAPRGRLLLSAFALTALALAGCLSATEPLDDAAVGTGLVSGLASAPVLLPPEGAVVTQRADAPVTDLLWQDTLATPEARPVNPPGLPGLPVVGNPVNAAFPPPDSWARGFEVPVGVTMVTVVLTWSDAEEQLSATLSGRGATQCRGRAPAGDDAPPATLTCTVWMVAPREASFNLTVSIGAGVGDGVADAEPFAVAVALDATPFRLRGPALPAAEASPALAFWDRVVSPDRRSAEPSVKVDAQGVVWLAAPTGAMGTLWRSIDDGRSFMPIDIEANGGATGFAWDAIGRGGGDAEVFVTPDGREVYFSDLWSTCMTVAGSADAGETWHVNPFSCELPGTDRQWLAAEPGGHLWMTMNANTLGGSIDQPGSPWGLTVFHSIDGGQTWLTRTSVPEDACFRGNIAVHSGNVYVGGCNADGPGVAVSHDGGRTFEWVTVAQRSGEPLGTFCYPCGLFTVVDVDAAGNVYLTWADPSDGDGGSFDVWFASSRDQGLTWSEAVRVNHAPGSAILPWLAAGEEGHVALVWVQTVDQGRPDRLASEWYVHMAETTDALADPPVFAEALVDPAPVQYGPVCISGSACAGQRNLLDFIMVDIGPRGEAHIAYTDGTHGGSYANAYIKYAQQTTGLAMDAPAPEQTDDQAAHDAQGTL